MNEQQATELIIEVKKTVLGLVARALRARAQRQPRRVDPPAKVDRIEDVGASL